MRNLIKTNFLIGAYILTLTLLWATIVAQNKPSAARCGDYSRRVNFSKKYIFFIIIFFFFFFLIFFFTAN